MATIAQPSLFSWATVEAHSDLDRLELVLSVLPDEALMKRLEQERGHGRDDYPVRAVWNSIIAGIVFQHPSIESLRRELQRNGELRLVCGFSPLKGSEAVPGEWVYTRFLRRLVKCPELVQAMFDALVDKLAGVLPDLGRMLAGDSKALASAGQPTTKKPDGRRETDATWGKKEYRGRRADGSSWEKVVRWFGFKVHLLVDSTYELPLAWRVTTAGVNDTTEMLPLLKETAARHGEILERGECLSLDKGYDSAKNNREILDEYGIKPLIDNRALWKDGEKTKAVPRMEHDRIVYDERGTLFCVHGSSHDCRRTEVTPMYFDGFEADRGESGVLKYRCPAAVYGYECPEREHCGRSKHGRVVRVALELDRRIFVPVPRNTLKWKRLYATRTAVERVNSRIANGFVFDHHYIRGLKKMKLRIGLALVIMLAVAYGSILAGRSAQMRSLVGRIPHRQAA